MSLPFAFASPAPAPDHDVIRDAVRGWLAGAGLIVDDAPPHELTALADVIRAAQACPRTLLPRDLCMTIAGHKKTTQIEREQSGVYRRVVVGNRVFVTAESFWSHLIGCAAEPFRKVRGTDHLRKPVRKRTQAELDGLKQGNEGRPDWRPCSVVPLPKEAPNKPS